MFGAVFSLLTIILMLLYFPSFNVVHSIAIIEG